MIPIIQDVSIAIGLLALLLVAFEAGFRAARRATDGTDARAGGQIGTIQGEKKGGL
jgi:hypothetical protein